MSNSKLDLSNEISAVIPVKKNSSRLENKNILPIGNTNLLKNKIIQLKSLDKLKEIIVTSDSDEMLDMATELDVTAIKRPTNLADESRPLSDFFDYVCEIINGKHLLWACCTSPLVGTTLFKKAIELYFLKLNEGFDSLITVTEFKHYLLDSNGPLNYGYGLQHKNSQELPNLHLFTNGALLAPIDKVKEWHYNYGKNPYRMIISQKESIDIDTYYDYLAAKAWYEESQ